MTSKENAVGEKKIFGFFCITSDPFFLTVQHLSGKRRGILKTVENDMELIIPIISNIFVPKGNLAEDLSQQ